MQKTAGWEKKEKKGQRCAGLPPFRGFDSGCGIEYNGKSCARPRRPPERGGRGDGQGALPKSESRERRLST